MIPSRHTLTVINDSLATSSVFWNNDPQTIIALVVSPFVAGPDLDLSSLTLASFTGSTPIDIPVAPQLQILDNQSGRVGVMMKEPVGGFKWICTAPPDDPQTVYGWIIFNDDDDLLFFSDVLPVPIVIAAVGNAVELTAVVGYLSEDAYGNLDGSL